MTGTRGERSGRKGREIEIGTAAEYLVCADLIMAGYRAFPAAQGLAYDVILDVDGRLIRVSVKSAGRAAERPSRENSRLCYQFGATRNKRNSQGKTSARPYTAADTDMMAFVALDIRLVAYAALVDKFVTGWHIDPPHTPRSEFDRLGRRNGQNRKRFEDFTLDRALLAMGAIA